MCSFAQYYLKQHAHQKHVGPAIRVSFHSFFIVGLVRNCYIQ